MTPRRLIEPARLAGSALLHTQSDERLVDLARAGNDRAFEAIVARYRRPLLRFCGRILPPERAEDAVQQTFLNAYRAIGDGSADLNLRPWLYRIAHNASLSLLRQNGWSHEELDEQFDGVPQPPQEVEQSERLREVMRAVRDLPERQRDAVVLRELEGRSYEEIAAALGVSGGAVRQLLNRARTNLRAAATAVTPLGLAELSAGGAAGAGGLTAAAKLGTALVVAGAVAGGTTGAGPLPDVVGDGSTRGGDQAVAAEADPAGAGRAEPRNDEGPSDRTGRERGDDRREDDDRRGDDDRDPDDDGSGDGDDDRSGPGDGDGDDDSDSSGSGSGSSGSGSGSSGSGDAGDGSSGSGSDSSGSGSGSSGSGDAGDGSSGNGSDSSGPGSSGSGSGTSGSGSGSSASGSGTSGSGSGSSASGSGTSGSGSGSGGSGSGATDSGSSGSGIGSGSSGSD